MGYRGKIDEQNRARDLRQEGWSLKDIAAELHVSKSSVSLWVRDVEFELRPKQRARKQRPGKLEIAKQEEIEHLLRGGRERIGQLTEIPVPQILKPYRAVPDPSIRTAKHIYGCPGVAYSCSRTLRTVMGLVHALLSCDSVLPG